MSEIARRVKPKIIFIHTGGTIASVRDPVTNSLRPARSGEELLTNANVKGLEDYEVVVVKPFGDQGVDSSRIEKLRHIHPLEKEIAKHANDPLVAGIVIGCGTDTQEYVIEHASYSLNNLGIPIVVTGAQKSADHPKADGPRNLRDAFTLIRKSFLPCGVHQVFAGTVLGPRNMFKADIWKKNPYLHGRAEILGHIARGVFIPSERMVEKKKSLRRVWQEKNERFTISRSDTSLLYRFLNPFLRRIVERRGYLAKGADPFEEYFDNPRWVGRALKDPDVIAHLRKHAIYYPRGRTQLDQRFEGNVCEHALNPLTRPGSFTDALPQMLIPDDLMSQTRIARAKEALESTTDADMQRRARYRLNELRSRFAKARKRAFRAIVIGGHGAGNAPMGDQQGSVATFLAKLDKREKALPGQFIPVIWGSNASGPVDLTEYAPALELLKTGRVISSGGLRLRNSVTRAGFLLGRMISPDQPLRFLSEHQRDVFHVIFTSGSQFPSNDARKKYMEQTGLPCLHEDILRGLPIETSIELAEKAIAAHRKTLAAPQESGKQSPS